jgi:RNA polymerase sigma-70 factor (ECF subfamily)
MPLEIEDAGLVARASQGDKNAFGDLYVRYMDDIYRYIAYRVNNHQQDAEDLTEQVFLKAWNGLDQYRGDVPFKAWIFRIARNTVFDFYRTRKEVLPLSEDSLVTDQNHDMEEKLLSKEQSVQLVDAIGQLSPMHQNVLILRFIIGLSVRDVAQILDRSEGAIKALQHRALKAARVFLMKGEITNG